MKSNDLIDIIGEANDEFIRDAKANQKQKVVRFPNWAKWSSAIAACLVLVIGCFTILPHFMPDDEAPASSAGGYTGHEEGTVFMSYAGPVFPLTLMNETVNLEASRNIGFDFSTYLEDGEDIEVWGNNGEGIIISDNYQLLNTSENDVTVTAIYPFVGDFQTTTWPVITLDENKVEYEINAGAYSGDFKGAGGNTNSLNLENITSWTEYKELLNDGSYIADAFIPPESLDYPVIVYKLSDLTDGPGEYEAATLCMRFKYNSEKTSILTWGFNGGGTRADTGDEYRDFFIREGIRKPDQNVKYFIVVGDDIESYELQGYLDGSCTPGEELDDASATVTRVEMSMNDLLREICKIRYDAIIDNEFDGDRNRYLDKFVTFDMYYEAVIKHFTTYGPAGTDPKERYGYGRLDDIIEESAYHNRILYLSFEVTIPAGSSVEVNIEQFKNASFDFDCSCSENAGIDGYDMVTSLGSNIAFTGQTASISNYDAIEIVRQNFGFDFANGITNVRLDLNEPHYYLEVRELDHTE